MMPVMSIMARKKLFIPTKICLSWSLLLGYYVVVEAFNNYPLTSNVVCMQKISTDLIETSVRKNRVSLELPMSLSFKNEHVDDLSHDFVEFGVNGFNGLNGVNGVNGLHSELAEKDAALERAIAGLEKAIGEIEQLKSERSQLHVQASKAEAKAQVLEKNWLEAQSAIVEIEKLKSEQIEQLKSKQNQLQKKLKVAESKAKQTENGWTEAVGAIGGVEQATSSQVENLKSERFQLQKKVNEAESKAQTFENNWKEATDALQESEKELSKISREHSALENKLSQSVQKVNEAESKARTFENNWKEAQNALRVSERELSKVSKVQSALENKVSQSVQKVNEAESKAQTFEKNWKEAQNALQVSEGELSKVSKEQSALENKLSHSVQEVNEAESKAQTFEKNWNEAQNALQVSEGELSKVSKEQSALENKLSQSVQEVKALQDQLDAMKAEAKLQEVTIKDLQSELVSVNKAAAATEKKLAQEEASAAKKAQAEARKRAMQEAQEEQLRKKIAQREALAAKKAEEEAKKKAAKMAKAEILRQKEEAMAAKTAQAEAKRRAAQAAIKAKREEAEAKRREAQEALERERAAKQAEAEAKKEERRRMMEMKKAEEETRRREAQEALEIRKAEIEEKKKQQAAANAMPVLNNWRLTDQGHLKGTVRGHPSIRDGDQIETSSLKDPAAASRQGAVVVTVSGTKYKLGTPSQPLIRFPATKVSGSMEIQKSEPVTDTETEEVARDLAEELGLTGATVGDNGRYLLAGEPKWSTNGRSQVWKAYRSDKNGLPTGDAVAIKISDKKEWMEKEHQNYKKATSGIFGRRGSFVVQSEFFPVLGGSFDSQHKHCGLVMELGNEDLSQFISRRQLGLEGNELRDAALSAARCIEALHAAHLVWTDLKSENFVVCGDGTVTVKGIDLESARPFRGNPIDYSPEACPPEFAEAFLVDEGLEFELDYSYDVWSFGMLLYEISTGRAYFDGKANTPHQIMKLLPDVEIKAEDFSHLIEDKKMVDLISQCLSTDPKKRPSVAQILLHPYFLSSPFSFF